MKNTHNTIAEGQCLWTPSAERIEQAQITAFIAWLDQHKGLSFTDYQALWQWSVDDQISFWSTVWEYFEVISDTEFLSVVESVVEGEDIFKASWFRGAKTNYAEHLLRYEARAGADEIAFFHSSEIRPAATLSWQDLGAQVRVLATRLRALGIKPGDRVVSYMPNIPETAVAMIATVAIGAIWSSAAPEFGSKTVIDRFGQIEPKLAFFADGYSFNGRLFDRRADIQAIVGALDSLEHIIWLDYLGTGSPLETTLPLLMFKDVMSGPAIAREDFEFTRVEWDHPLWVLYSSGTTGLPKAIMHSHVGIITDHLKALVLHCDLGPGKRMFFYSTTGWMMWNIVVSSLITGASAVLYDGSPTYGGVDALWRKASEVKATLFGASPTLVQSMKAANISPKELYDLSSLDTVLVAGSPSTPETFQWFYNEVASDLWLTSQSGGTDMCGGFVTGLPIQPVYAGEIQSCALGYKVEVWNDQGLPVVDDVGEVVITKPFPAAPLGFWGDDGSRYYASYFELFPGVWRHGDLVKINHRGGAYVYGRSDSTLNRYGVRIGTGEIYAVLESIAAVKDSLVICCEQEGGKFYMPLFVELDGHVELSDALIKEIVTALRTEASPRHVPDEILAVPQIPYTLTGKKMEIPIRKIVSGLPPESAASRDTMANPGALDWFITFAGSK